MGQKIHPVAFRIGITLKWKYAWYGILQDKINSLNQYIPRSKGLIIPLGGLYISNFEEIIQSILKAHIYSSLSKTYRRTIRNFRLYKGYSGILLGFVIFMKLKKTNAYK